jgi:hypothetical protein
MTQVRYHVAHLSPSKEDYIRFIVGSADQVLLRNDIRKRGMGAVMGDEWREVWMRDSYATYAEAIGKLTSAYSNVKVYEITLDELLPYYQEVMQ